MHILILGNFKEASHLWHSFGYILRLFLFVFLSSLMQEKWCWEAGMKKTNTSSLPAVGSLTTPKKNGTNTQWVYHPLKTLCWKSWHRNGQGWAKVSKISCSPMFSRTIWKKFCDLDVHNCNMALTKTKNRCVPGLAKNFLIDKNKMSVQINHGNVGLLGLKPCLWLDFIPCLWIVLNCFSDSVRCHIHKTLPNHLDVLLVLLTPDSKMLHLV